MKNALFSKVIKNYTKICEFLLSQAANSPVGMHMDFNLSKYVGHYACIEIKHYRGKVACLRVYDSYHNSNSLPSYSYSENYFYVGDNVKKISTTIAKDCPSIEMMKSLVIGWHRYGIKEHLLQVFHDAEAIANEKIKAEKEIDNFVV